MAGFTAGAATSLGFTGLLKEIVGEVGDLLEQVMVQMGQCVLWEETVTEKEYPRYQNKQKVTCETRVRHYKVTLMHVAFAYCLLRLAGIVPPLAQWPEAMRNKWPQYVMFGPLGGWGIDQFNQWVRPDTVPPPPAGATYDPWWGTYTTGTDADSTPHGDYPFVDPRGKAESP